MKFWVDMENSPHVLFFGPIIDELVRRGHEVVITARDSGHVRRLLDRASRSFVTVGPSAVAGPLGRYVSVIARAFALRQVARGENFDLAINHGSRSHIGAAALSRVACVTSYDYEHSSKLFVHSLIQRVYVPDILLSADSSIDTLSGRIIGYPGLKEHVYLSRFTPDSSVLTKLDINSNCILIVLRPPATTAHYHTPRSSQLVDSVLLRLSALPPNEYHCVILPRDDAQAAIYRRTWHGCGPLMVPPLPIDALSLMAFSDAVISGGGTMVREAAVMGVPAFSLFAGPTGAVDRYLADNHFMTLIRTDADLSLIPVAKSNQRRAPLGCAVDLSHWFADRLIDEASGTFCA